VDINGQCSKHATGSRTIDMSAIQRVKSKIRVYKGRSIVPLIVNLRTRSD
jgi:hypothetical protein